MDREPRLIAMEVEGDEKGQYSASLPKEVP